jgi:hypothetical protein
LENEEILKKKILDPGNIWAPIVFISNAFCQLDRLFRVPAHVVVVYAELIPDFIAPQYIRCRADAILLRPFPVWMSSRIPMTIRQGKNAEKEVWGSSVYVIELFVRSNASHWTLCPGVDALHLPQIIVIHGSVDSCSGPEAWKLSSNCNHDKDGNTTTLLAECIHPASHDLPSELHRTIKRRAILALCSLFAMLK